MAKFSDLVIRYLLLPVAIRVFSENFCKNYAVCDVTKLPNSGLPQSMESIGLKGIFANKGNCEKSLIHLFITCHKLTYTNAPDGKKKRSKDGGIFKNASSSLLRSSEYSYT